MPTQKIIFHIDMNSYFASCEQQANPFLRGKPIGICEHLGGIIIAPSIEAKKFGIKTGTPVWEAKKIYPKIILLHTDPEKYRNITAKFLKIFYSYTDEVEKYSIDEAFLDMTANFASTADFIRSEDPWVAARKTAQQIKDKIRFSAGEWIRCSVGIGENKLIAKIASDLQKPDGLVVIRPEDKESLYDRLKLTDIPGIAKRTEYNLNMLGIKTLRDLRGYSEQKLITRFGVMGKHLYNIGQLKNSWKEHSFAEDEAIKSMGHAYTLPQASADKKLALQVLCKLSEMVGRRLRAAKLAGTVIHFIITDKHGHFVSKQSRLNYSVCDGREIFLEASKIFEKSAAQVSQFRLVGVTVSGLGPYSKQQTLFGDTRRAQQLTGYLDKINDKYGDFTITRIPAWQARSVIRDSIGFGRMREFKVNFKRGK